uniref:RNA binding motif protein 45 n=1 Tax=Chinchilla lanigera TaxID=34839 RepID=A0A8C2W4P6_CHILA
MDEAGSSAGGGVSGFRPGVDSLDEPPNSRIFLVISKYTPEAVLRERFSRFGDIQDIWVVRDKHTKESKGIAFIKFARSSQACRAMEEMHGQCLEPNNTKPIKVFIAQSRSSGSHRDVEDEELTRIFVMIPKSYTEEDLREKFKVYGDIEYCSIIKNKVTGESKGLGYVRYLKPSQAAQAIENCDRSFRAILAEPKNKPSESSEQDYYSNMRQEALGHEPRVNMFPFDQQSEFPNFDKNENRGQEAISKRLSVVSRVPFTEEQLFSIFDIVPGLEYCEVQRDPYSNYVYLVSGKNVGYAKFADRMSANDAISTLHGKILNGVRLKVMLADSPREESNKRQRTY